MRRATNGIALSMFLGLAAGVPASAQSVAEIVERMYEAVDKNAKGVDNYTLVQSVMGFETATYFEKEVVDGRAVFRARQTGASGMGRSMSYDGLDQSSIAELGPGLVEHGRYAGRDRVEGHVVHVIAVDDLSALDMEAPPAPEDMEFTAKSGSIYVDAELFVPRRMVFSGEAVTETGTHEVTTSVDMLDYREVDGLLVPHRSVISIQGIDAMMDPEMQARLDEMQAQLKDLDPERRAMLERMPGPQMEQIRNMAAGGNQPMTMEITVSEVRVNSGPPGR